MDENTTKRPRVPVPAWIDTLVALLHLVTMAGQATLSIYTSRKGRVWVALKNWDPHVYSTSAEISPGADPYDFLMALAVACSEHYMKQRQMRDRIETWAALHDVMSMQDAVRDWMHAFFHDGALPDTYQVSVEPGSTNGVIDGASVPDAKTTKGSHKN